MIAERLPWCEPVEAASRLRPLGGLAFLDSAMPGTLSRWSYVAANPYGRLRVEGGRASWNGAPSGREPLVLLRGALERGAAPLHPDLPNHDDRPPFVGGAIGYLGYEFGASLHDLPLPGEGVWGAVPEVDLGFYDTVLAFDHASRTVWLLSSGSPEHQPEQRESRARERVAAFRGHLAGTPPAELACPAVPRSAWISNFDRASYSRAVADVIEAILDGEIFQANIAQRFMAPTPPGFDAWAFYRRLRQENPAPFAAYLEDGERAIASSSPELFLTLTGDLVETRPIKGTSPRAADPEQDHLLAERLAASEKDRAENLMIVDLLRNDLSRVCRPHTVETPALCEVESYAGVHHLVSGVTGRLRPGLDAIDVVAACFPGGSVTGAPKHQAMRVIARTEREARGVYCGSIVALGSDGLLGNIAIRTVLLQQGRAVFQAGGGITALSDPEAEYQETLDKAARIFRAFEGPDEVRP